jgi:hypothetical protein
MNSPSPGLLRQIRQNGSFAFHCVQICSPFIVWSPSSYGSQFNGWALDCVFNSMPLNDVHNIQLPAF